MITLIPAYYKDYTSIKSIKKALINQVDFRVLDHNSKWNGMVENLQDLKNIGCDKVEIIYSNCKKRTTFNMEDLC